MCDDDQPYDQYYSCGTDHSTLLLTVVGDDGMENLENF